MLKYLLLSILIIIALFFYSCSKPSDPTPPDPQSAINHAPRIDSITITDHTGNSYIPGGLDSVKAKTTMVFRVFATDPDSNVSLSYNWSATAGTFNSKTSQTVYWTGPDASRNIEVTVSVSDDSLSVSKKISFRTYTSILSLSEGTYTDATHIIPGQYEYRVKYTDQTGQPPKSYKVIIDSQEYDMVPPGGSNNADGYYMFGKTILTGNHSYSFKFVSADNQTLYFPESGYLIGPYVFEDNEIVINDNLISTDNLNNFQLVDTTNSFYAFNYTGTPPLIKTDDIIFSKEDGGYLRKVTGTNYLQNQVILSTTQASLADAFEEISFDTTLTIVLDNSLYEKSQNAGKNPYLAPGVSLSAGEVILDSTILYQGSVDNADVKIFIETGSISYQPSLEVDVDISLTNKEVYTAAIGEMTIDVTPKVEASAHFSKSGEKHIGSIPIPLDWAAIPAEIVFSLYAGYEVGASVEGMAKVNVTNTTTLTMGCYYDNGTFSPVFDTSTIWYVGESVWSAEANAYLKLYIKPKISLKVLHVAGPFLDAIPYARFQGTVTANPFCWEYGVYGGVDANVGLELDIFLFDKSYSIPIFGAEDLLYGDSDCPGQDNVAPGAVTTLEATNPTSSSITLNWISTGDDGYSGQASAYDIRYSTSPINEGNWPFISQASDEPNPKIAGLPEQFIVNGLIENTSYNFAIKTRDESNNWSELSNIATGTPQGTGGDIYEPNNDSSIATVIYHGTVQEHSIKPLGDIDWFKFEIHETTKFVFKMFDSLNGGGPFAQVYRNNRALSSYGGEYEYYTHYNSEIGTTSTIWIDEAIPGTYYIKHIGTGLNQVVDDYRISFTIENNSNETVTDIDGNVYQTVTIGNQVWMAENLNVTHYRNGDPIPNVIDNDTWNYLTTGAYCDYDDTESNSEIYGKLYNLYAVLDDRRVAPEGWHIPSDEDWKELELSIGMSQEEVDATDGRGTMAGKLKEEGTDHWNDPNIGATNESGFTALPAGFRRILGYPYHSKGYIARYWTSTSISSSGYIYGWFRGFFNDRTYIDRSNLSAEVGLSLRCVKDQ